MTTASIVTYRHHIDEISPILRSLFASPVDTIYIIDHSQKDFGLEAELNEFLNDSQKQTVRYLLHENNGYGGGHNIALKMAMEQGSKYHLVVNPDVWFGEDVIPYVTAYMDNHADCAQIMPKVYYPNGKLQRLAKRLPTPMDIIGRLCAPKALIRERNDRFILDDTHYALALNVPFLSGCFMFLRLDALKEVGYFDERFFMYAEDIDLTRRIHRRYKTMFLPDVQIYHKFSRASRKDICLFFVHVSSIIKYFNKWGWLNDAERDAINQRLDEEIKSKR